MNKKIINLTIILLLALVLVSANPMFPLMQKVIKPLNYQIISPQSDLVKYKCEEWSKDLQTLKGLCSELKLLCYDIEERLTLLEKKWEEASREPGNLGTTERNELFKLMYEQGQSFNTCLEQYYQCTSAVNLGNILKNRVC
ncbi:MAG: hypothetical protein Q8P57_00580 [Candidatus Pacearchaeota archaeon]|nr:hypothetical protein [Candidatus Pacearchaeota archaeon]